MTLELENQLKGMGALLQLQRKARQADTREVFGFVVVNETRLLVPYRQAALWYRKDRSDRIVALSGLAVPDTNAPFVVWLTRILRQLTDAGEACGLRTLTAADLPETERVEWADWLPEHALWLPIPLPGDGGRGGVLLARRAVWNAHEQRLLEHLAEAYGHAWDAMECRTGRQRPWRAVGGRRWAGPVLLLALIAVLALPVRQSVLAPATVTALNPTIVRAPLEGVVDRFHIGPNQPVQSGQRLLSLDATTLQNRLEVARMSLSVIRAEYRQAAQKAVFDKESKALLTVLKGRVEQQDAETVYVEELLDRIHVRADRAGIAVFDDVNDWLGKPVAVGERILEIADPEQVELDIRLSIGDAIHLEQGAEVVLFLKSGSQHPLPAVLRFISYKAGPTADGILAYRLKAGFPDNIPQPRIGQHGIAKIYGDRVPLFHYLLRRPLAALRQFLGT